MRVPYSELVTKREAAESYHVSEATIHRWMKAGRIAFTRLPGGQPRFAPRKDPVLKTAPKEKQ